MLDVVLYGRDDCGQLTLKEQAFHSLRGLTHFFGSRESIPWEWAEVTRLEGDGPPRVVRYSADALRAMLDVSTTKPSMN